MCTNPSCTQGNTHYSAMVRERRRCPAGRWQRGAAACSAQGRARPRGAALPPAATRRRSGGGCRSLPPLPAGGGAAGGAAARSAALPRLRRGLSGSGARPRPCQCPSGAATTNNSARRRPSRAGSGGQRRAEPPAPWRGRTRWGWACTPTRAAGNTWRTWPRSWWSPSRRPRLSGAPRTKAERRPETAFGGGRAARGRRRRERCRPAPAAAPDGARGAPWPSSPCATGTAGGRRPSSPGRTCGASSRSRRASAPPSRPPCARPCARASSPATAPCGKSCVSSRPAAPSSAPRWPRHSPRGAEDRGAAVCFEGIARRVYWGISVLRP